jgi:hypothetical protein
VILMTVLGRSRLGLGRRAHGVIRALAFMFFLVYRHTVCHRLSGGGRPGAVRSKSQLPRQTAPARQPLLLHRASTRLGDALSPVSAARSGNKYRGQIEIEITLRVVQQAGAQVSGADGICSAWTGTAQYSRQGTGPQQRGPGTGSRGQRGRLSGSLCVNLCLEARLGGGWRGDD